MGLSSKKTKTTSTPTVLPAFTAGQSEFADLTRDFLGMDPTQFVAPASPLQEQAFAGAQSLGGWQPYATQARDMATSAAGMPAPSVTGVGYNAPQLGPASTADFRSVLDDGGIQKFMNPALDAYVNNALSAYDQNAGERAAQMAARAAGSGAFGGSRYGLAEGQFAADTAQKRALTESGLRSQAFGDAANLAVSEAGRRQGLDTFNADAANRYGLAQAGLTADASQFGAAAQNTANLTNAQMQEQAYLRQLQAAGLVADIGSNYGAQDRADLGLTADLGQMQRGIASEYSNALPTQLQLARMLYPPESYVGQNSTSKTSGGALGQILGTAAQIGSTIAFSDRRLKSDVQRIGSHGPLGLYRFTMDGRPGTGVMADEVAIHAPHALGPVVGGYATVRYDLLGLAHLVGA